MSAKPRAKRSGTLGRKDVYMLTRYRRKSVKCGYTVVCFVFLGYRPVTNR